jgi:hypothetical protein
LLWVVSEKGWEAIFQVEEKHPFLHSLSHTIIVTTTLGAEDRALGKSIWILALWTGCLLGAALSNNYQVITCLQIMLSGKKGKNGVLWGRITGQASNLAEELTGKPGSQRWKWEESCVHKGELYR